MYKDLKRTCTVIVLLITPFVSWRSRFRCRLGLVNLSSNIGFMHTAVHASNSKKVYK